MKIVVTGASSGIGKFLAESLAAENNEICRLSRSMPQGFGFSCDVSNWDVVKNCAEKIASSWHSLDALVCCAGIQDPIGPAMDLDPREWRRNIEVNLDGTFFPIRALFPLLKKSSMRAKIVCFSGGGSTSPRPNFAAYGVSKTGVVRLVETLAAEWAGSGPDINAIAPGAIFTSMTEQVLRSGAGRAGQKEFEQASRLPRDNAKSMLKVVELAKFLLCSDSDGITGKLISAQWDPWAEFGKFKNDLAGDLYTLRRIVPEDRGKDRGKK